MSHDEATSCKLMQILRQSRLSNKTQVFQGRLLCQMYTPPSYTYKMHNYSIYVNGYGSYPHNQNVGKTPNDPMNF